MPLLTVTTTLDPDPEEREAFSASLADAYAAEMHTGTGHAAVEFRGNASLWLGRAVDGDLFVLDADVREGRPHERRRAFALAAMDLVRERWALPRANLKVVFTEHAGDQMMGYDRVGGDWTPAEGESGDGDRTA